MSHIIYIYYDSYCIYYESYYILDSSRNMPPSRGDRDFVFLKYIYIYMIYIYMIHIYHKCIAGEYDITMLQILTKFLIQFSIHNCDVNFNTPLHDSNMVYIPL